jgi:hypothetical protein
VCKSLEEVCGLQGEKEVVQFHVLASLKQERRGRGAVMQISRQSANDGQLTWRKRKKRQEAMI